MRVRSSNLLTVVVSILISIIMTGASQPTNVGLANPASEYCISQGGTLEIVKDKDGNEVGMCKLPDGRVVEEWDFFRSQQPPTDTTTEEDRLALDKSAEALR